MWTQGCGFIVPLTLNLRQEPLRHFVGVRRKKKAFCPRNHRLRANVRICAYSLYRDPHDWAYVYFSLLFSWGQLVSKTVDFPGVYVNCICSIYMLQVCELSLTGNMVFKFPMIHVLSGLGDDFTLTGRKEETPGHEQAGRFRLNYRHQGWKLKLGTKDSWLNLLSPISRTTI